MQGHRPAPVTFCPFYGQFARTQSPLEHQDEDIAVQPSPDSLQLSRLDGNQVKPLTQEPGTALHEDEPWLSGSITELGAE